MLQVIEFEYEDEDGDDHREQDRGRPPGSHSICMDSSNARMQTVALSPGPRSITYSIGCLKFHGISDWAVLARARPGNESWRQRNNEISDVNSHHLTWINEIGH